MTHRGRRVGVLRSTYIRYFLPALAAVTVVNLAIVPFLPAGGQAIRLHPSPRLSVISTREPEPVGVRYELYLLLGELGGGATLTVPTGDLIDPELIRSLSGMHLVVDPTTAVPAGRRKPADVTGWFGDPSGSVRPFLIFTRGGDGNWTAHREGSAVLFVEGAES